MRRERAERRRKKKKRDAKAMRAGSERKGRRDRQRRSSALHQINVITALIGQTLDRRGHRHKGKEEEGGDETEGEV